MIRLDDDEQMISLYPLLKFDVQKLFEKEKIYFRVSNLWIAQNVQDKVASDAKPSNSSYPMLSTGRNRPIAFI